MSDTHWMGTKAAAATLDVNVRTIYRLIDEGRLAAYKFGRVIRIKESDLDAYVMSQRIRPMERAQWQ